MLEDVLEVVAVLCDTTVTASSINITLPKEERFTVYMSDNLICLINTKQNPDAMSERKNTYNKSKLKAHYKI